MPAEGVTLSEAEAAMDRVITEFMDNPIDKEALDRIKSSLRASEIYEMDSVVSRAQKYGRALTQGLTVEDVAAWPDIVQSITPDQIKAAAERVLDLNQSVTGWVVGSPEQAS